MDRINRKNTSVFCHDSLVGTFSKKWRTVPVIQNHDHCNCDLKNAPVKIFHVREKNRFFPSWQQKKYPYFLTKKGPETLYSNLKKNAVCHPRLTSHETRLLRPPSPEPVSNNSPYFGSRCKYQKLFFKFPMYKAGFNYFWFTINFMFDLTMGENVSQFEIPGLPVLQKTPWLPKLTWFPDPPPPHFQGSPGLPWLTVPQWALEAKLPAPLWVLERPWLPRHTLLWGLTNFPVRPSSPWRSADCKPRKICMYHTWHSV